MVPPLTAYMKRLKVGVHCSSSIRDWSKSIGWGGPEQRGGGSSVFEPLVRGGSFNFQLPMGVGHPIL